eukprot:28228-Eustigmatos_ZCMA.PRE.1
MDVYLRLKSAYTARNPAFSYSRIAGTLVRDTNKQPITGGVQPRTDTTSHMRPRQLELHAILET